jgi:hypothetical protein
MNFLNLILFVEYLRRFSVTETTYQGIKGL